MTGHLAVWRITPVANPEDGAWQARVTWKKLQIVASTASGALLEAGRHFDAERGISGAVSLDGQQVRSGFFNVRLTARAAPTCC